MDHPGKKSVRFSSPFDFPNGAAGITKQFSSTKAQLQQTNTKENMFPFPSASLLPSSHIVELNSSSTSSVCGDSWDAFDAKMIKKSTATPKQVQTDELLELSATQNKSLNHAEDDFFAMSFQDAKSMIDKDENERMMFMNSNSFNEDLDHMEAPSLLSVTSYFQANSSFPVPYVGNESTMMFGEIPNLGLPPSKMQDSINSSLSQSKTTRRTSSSIHPSSRSISTIDRRASATSSTGYSPPMQVDLDSDEKFTLERTDSLGRFFYGTESNGIMSGEIIDYVMEYCKRRASFRNSDVSLNLPSTPPNAALQEVIDGLNQNSREAEVARTHYDSEINISDDKTVVNLEKSQKTEESIPDVSNLAPSGIFKLPENKSNDKNRSAHPSVTSQNKEDEREGSIIISDGGSVSRAFLDISESDVGEIGGFEKFKQNLKGRHEMQDNRYRRMKLTTDREEFEKKRLQIDEKYSHPELSPTAKASRGEGPTTSLERPRNPMICNSPPEKLVSSKTERERVGNNTSVPNELRTPRRFNEDQCHSTPITAESFLQKFINPSLTKSGIQTQEKAGESSKSKSTTEKVETHDKYKRQRKTSFSGRTSLDIRSDRRCSSNQHLQRIQKSARDKDAQTQAVEKESSNPNSLTSTNVLKPSNKPPQDLKLPVAVPVSSVVNTAMQYQQHQSHQFPIPQQIVSQFGTTPTACSCPHQCGAGGGHLANPHGIPAMPHGMPIVIHIHLPCPTGTLGTGVYSVAGTPTTTEAPK